MRGRELIGAIALSAIGIFVAWQSLRLGTGTVAHPGAGFLPLVLAVLLAITGVVLAVQARPAGAAQPVATDSAGRGDAPRARKALAAVALMVAYGLALEPLGFVATTTMLLAALFVIGYGRRALLPAIIGAAAGAVLAYLLFEGLLDAGLPTGALWTR